MAHRALLHKRKGVEFEKWLLKQGYKLQQPKGPYEKLRWKGGPGEPMPIIFDRHDAKEHFTCNESAYWYVKRFIRENREA